VDANGDAAPANRRDDQDQEAYGTAERHLAAVLAGMAGPGAVPRPDQVEAVAALVGGRRVLLVQATGWGKSAAYWAATAALREAGHGPTLVISPLLALMRDQVTAAEKAGLRAATVNSANVDDWQVVFDALGADEIDVLLVSPERLANPKFADRALPPTGASTSGRTTSG
jgi:ATP-dependent DNA helicase RecQ